jgi:hypothetical protein
MVSPRVSPSGETIDRYSVRPGAAPGAPLTGLAPEDVVLVPPPEITVRIRPAQSPLQAGFALARQLLGQGRTVRLIAEGATVPAGWPGWVRQEPRLLVTELGAYRSPALISWSQGLRAAVEQWLETTFAGALPPGLPAADVFYSVACDRLFQRLFNVARFLEGLVQHHGSARFHCADPTWVGLAALQRAVAGSGGTVSRAPPRQVDDRWRQELMGAVHLAVIRSALGQLRAYQRSTSARRWLREQARLPANGPDLWLAVAPCWGARANQHVVETVGLPALRRGLRVGVLLTTSLDGGPEGRAAKAPAGFWPVLGDILPPAQDVGVAQAVFPDDRDDLVATLCEAGRAAVDIARRIGARDPVLRLDELELDLRDHLPGLARLLGTDLMLALTTGRATQAVISRSPGQVPVIFSMLNLVESAAPGAWLRRAGLITVDFVHGTGADLWHGASETRASYRAVWTAADAETVKGMGQRPVVTGIPRLSAPSPPRAGRPSRILVLSNYVHDGWEPADYPLRFHQAELLRAVQLVRARFGERFEYRWRPHPADNPAEVAEGLRQSPGLARSPSPSLEEDLAWSDIIIASNSSSSIEALLWGRPIFLHLSPSQRFLPEVLAFAEERRFFHAGDLPDKLAACLALLDRGDPLALAPEISARAALHGPDAPAPLPVLDTMIALGPC